MYFIHKMSLQRNYTINFSYQRPTTGRFPCSNIIYSRVQMMLVDVGIFFHRQCSLTSLHVHGTQLTYQYKNKRGIQDTDVALLAFFRFRGFNDTGGLNTVSQVEQMGPH